MQISELFRQLGSFITRLLNIRVNWSSVVQPTIGQIIIFVLAVGLIVWFLRRLL